MHRANEPIKVISQTPFLRLVTIGSWSFVQRAGTSGVVTVVARTPEDEVLLVEQFRPPVQARVIELPAGLAGDIAGSEDESLELAARRELLEETGFEAESMKRLFSGPSSAGLTDEVITFFLADGLKQVGPGGGDESERIVVHRVPMKELDAWLAAKVDAGCLLDARLFSGLYFLRVSSERTFT
ncbi:MAG: NUDIX hydrolase [Pirellulaceae bacterium]|nr:NUDIX hydrolase [Planctomycetales bacterium]